MDLYAHILSSNAIKYLMLLVDEDLVSYGRATHEAFLHPFTAVEAGNAVSARLEDDLDGSVGAHQTIGRRRRNGRLVRYGNGAKVR